MKSGAVLTPDGLFRVRLWRIWDASLPCVLWLMLNPSTADASSNDRTIERIIAFAKIWGYGGIEVCNAYAYRTKSPALLKAAGYPSGPGNDLVIETMLEVVYESGGIVVAGWGAHCQPERAMRIRIRAQRLAVPLHYLALNADGSPKHPLYIRRDVKPSRWAGPACA